jgi:hypothetical protein
MPLLTDDAADREAVMPNGVDADENNDRSE